MTCLSCEERARMLKQARDAFYSGDLETTERLLKEVFGTVKFDIKNLKSIVFKTRERGDLHNLKDVAAADPNDRRSENEKKYEREREGGK